MIQTTTITTIGSSRIGLKLKPSARAACKSVATEASNPDVSMFRPMIVYKINAITKVGPVVETIAVTWSNKPVSETAAARFVVSESGENLSPT